MDSKMQKEIFSGLKILDFTWVVAGPWIVTYFAAHGAEVVHIESSEKHPDLLRRTPPYKDGVPGIDNSAYFAQYHYNQYGLTLDITHPDAIEVIKDLVKWADVVTENFTAEFMERVGLGYEDLKKIKPDIIMLRQSQLGQTGPHRFMSGTGVQLTGLAGMSHLCGWPDGEPSVVYGGFTDYAGARLGAAALVAALLYRHQTGKGQCIDVSQLETSGYSFSVPLLDYFANKRIAKRNGNHSTCAFPHGVYPCKGEDRWCAITIFTESEWHSFCQATGNSHWQENPKFSTIDNRRKHEDELDNLVAQWTSRYSAEEIMERLQKAGVRAGIVKNSQDMHDDPQLKSYKFYWEQDHPVIGKHKCDSHAFTFSKTPRKLKFPSPCVGEHNFYVCTEILKKSSDEFIQLLEKGVLR